MRNPALTTQKLIEINSKNQSNLRKTAIKPFHILSHKLIECYKKLQVSFRGFISDFIYLTYYTWALIMI